MTMPARRAIPLISAAVLALLLSKKIFGAPSLPADNLDSVASRFATLDDAKVHYKSIGDSAAKTAVVFVHGWSCDLTVWRAQVPAFEGKARILLVDLPGHGRSDRPAVDYSMDRFARAIDAVMKDAGVERALLVGHSMGTPVIRQFWRLFPEKTIGLVAVDGPLRTYTKDPKQIQSFLDHFSGPDFAKTMNGFLDSMFVASTPEDVKASVRAIMGGATQQVAVSAMKGMFDLSIWKDDPIRVPLELIVAKSPNWSADYFAYVKTLNPSAEIVEMPDAGHFVMMENPAEFNATLIAFAARAGAIPMRAVRPGRPEDVSSPEAIVKAVYDVISGPAGKARDWDRFRSLFADGGRLIPVGRRAAGDFGPRVLDPEAYVTRATPIFEKEGFFESEISHRSEAFGHIAHVFSTYDSRHAPSDPKPFARGINSFQLVFDGTRWWVVTIVWEAESETLKIPATYLPPS